MIRFLLTFALAASAVVAQAQSSGTPQQLPTLRDRNQQTPPATPSTLPAGAAVITLHGLCSAPAADPSQCTTVISREQFERLLDSLNTSNQPIAPEQRRNLAQAYVDIMITAQAAEKAGLEHEPKFAESMRVFRLKMLKDFYLLALEEKYRTPSAIELQGYYNQNQPKFEEFTLSRILIPARNPAAVNKTEWEDRAVHLAGVIHDRAVRGEPFETLQSEAYTTLGLTTPPPRTTFGARRRSASPTAEEQEIFSLEVGGVSKVEQESNGYNIYKLEGKQTLPFDKVKDQVSKLVTNAKVDEQMKALQSGIHTDFNGEYFGPEATAPAVVPGAPTLQRPTPPK